MGTYRVLTIGRAPRDDIVAELRDVLGNATIEVRGALDDVDDERVDAMQPFEDADALHTRLPSIADRPARDVIISKKLVTEQISSLIERGGDTPTIVGCTGAFSGLPVRANVLLPSTVLAGLVNSLLPSGKLGVLVPIPQQMASFEERWSLPDRPATAVALKPGTDPSEAIDVLRSAGVDLVVLDCFGFSDDTRRAVREGVGRPVLSAVRCTAHIASELLQ